MRLRKPSIKNIRHKKAWLVVLVLLAVLVCGGAVVARTLSGPAIGTVETSMPSAAPPPQVELAQFDGTIFSFVHPVTLVEQTLKQQPIAGQIEAKTFLTSGMTGEYLTIVVAKFNGTSLQDDPSYLSRMQDDKKYQRKNIVVKNQTVTIFTSNDGQQLQQAAFLLHEGKEMSFVLTGIASNTQTMQEEFTTMLQSVTWR